VQRARSVADSEARQQIQAALENPLDEANDRHLHLLVHARDPAVRAQQTSADQRSAMLLRDVRPGRKIRRPDSSFTVAKIIH
jgi:predicted negative regulator of RcsB-dependent stress response